MYIARSRDTNKFSPHKTVEQCQNAEGRRGSPQIVANHDSCMDYTWALVREFFNHELIKRILCVHKIVGEVRLVSRHLGNERAVH
jgi:hypothetical protein